ncbi:hypothetical protein AB0H12_35385 [Actinosynnema sp. NPDC023794]
MTRRAPRARLGVHAAMSDLPAALGGTVSVRRAPGRGGTFTVTVPRVESTEAARRMTLDDIGRRRDVKARDIAAEPVARFVAGLSAGPSADSGPVRRAAPPRRARARGAA